LSGLLFFYPTEVVTVVTGQALIQAALVQHPCDEDPRVNRQRAEAGIRRAGEEGANLVILQELHGMRYPCQHEDVDIADWAEPIPGPSTEAFGPIAREWGVVLVLSLFERRAPGLYHNTAVVLERDGRIAGRYRKMHIPDDPGYQEKFYFTPGDQGFTPIDTSVGRLGVLVCWDQWFPEAARLMALAGADVLIYPTAIGWDLQDPVGEQSRQREAWQVIQRGHAIANALPVLVCNRSGQEPAPDGGPGIRFWGGSFIAGPQGEVLAEASAGSEETLVASLDRGRTERIRRLWPFFRDRRIDAYKDLTRRFSDSGDDPTAWDERQASKPSE